MSESPAWAKGHPLDLLREIAKPFAEQFKPHIYGAFGLPKEAEIAAAIEAKEAIWTREGGKSVQASALFRLFRDRGSAHSDFAGRKAQLAAGDLFIRAIAGTDLARQHLVTVLDHSAHPPAIWIEDLVESPRSALWLAMGFERIMTKIAASSDIRGLWHMGDPEGRLPPALDRADRPSLARLDRGFVPAGEIEAALEEISAYVAANAGAWAQHYSSYNKRQSWTALAIRGFDPADPGFIIKPAEMSRKWRADHPERLQAECGDTIAAPAFPRIRAIAARLPGRPQRIRLMRLASGGGELTRHADIVDPEAGTADGLTCRLHIPLQSPPECRFLSWDLDGQKLAEHFPAGQLFYLDTRKPHAVINPGDRDRIHIVIDQFSSPELRRMIASA